MGSRNIIESDYIGKVFGFLTIISLDKKESDRKCLAKCICGNYCKKNLANLKNGNTKSCGCYRTKFRITHGETTNGVFSKEFNAWHHIKDRCNNPLDKAYKNYGARGVSICKEWDISFQKFISDVGRAPSRDHSIDRIDNNGHYEPGNCRWATKEEQTKNMRRNIIVEYNGEKHIAKDMAKKLSIPYSTFLQAIKRGISVNEIISNRKL